MGRKIIVLAVVVLTAYIMLPFGFGLWNENIGIRGQISFAVIPSQSPELMPADNNSEPTESTGEETDTSSGSEQSEEVQESTEPQTAVTGSPENSTSAEPQESGVDETVSPEAVLPVDTAADAENAAQVQPEAENASDA